MANQLPIIIGTRAINATSTASISLIGRGLSAIQRKKTDIEQTEQDARYRQVLDIYNRITDYGRLKHFNADLLPKPIELVEDKKLLQLQPFFAMIQQLADVFTTFQQLADTGYGKAYFPLASIYQGGQGISQKIENIEKAYAYSCLAFDWSFANQALNDPDIWRDLGCMHHSGRGIERNDKQALIWFHKAAEQDHADAQYYLGWLYLYGCGIKQDVEQAVLWYRKAAEQGHAGAQYNLGTMRNEASVYDKANEVRWFHKAAEQGYAEAQWYSGEIEQVLGKVFGEQYEKALFWYRKAAEQGHAGAQWHLGNMYREADWV